MTEKNLCFIGAGNMCRAIVNGLLMGGKTDCEHIKVYDRLTEKAMAFKAIGIYSAKSISDAAEFGDFIFLCVKPQNMDEVLSELAACDTSGKVIVTIAAGITTKHINSFIGENIPVIRIMPNTPMLIGKGAAAICRNGKVSDGDFDTVCDMFKALGTVRTMTEDKLNPVISVSGSSPAYVYLFIKAMCDWACKNGFDGDTAKALVCASVIGSAEMVECSSSSVDDLIKAVSSPGGTTLAALAEFERLGFTDAISSAMDACARRAEELSK